MDSKMQKGKVNVAVVGAGAIGGVTAAFLARAGWDPEVVCKHQKVVDRINAQGLHVFGVKGEWLAHVKAVRGIQDLSGTKDVVFLATKATDCVLAAQELLPFLDENSAVVSLQNGICEDAIGEVVGGHRVVGCVVAWGATMHGPADLEMTSSGEFVIGNMANLPDQRLEPLREMLSAVAPTRISENIMGELYSKLIINSCINSLGVITGLTLGKLLAQRRIRNTFTGLMREAMAVAHAAGVKVEPGGGGKLDYYRFLADNRLMAELKRHVVIRLIGFKYRKIRSSSLQSLERGRQTEIDYLNGYICRRGVEQGVPTPLNRAVVNMVKEIEAGERSIGLKNLDDLVFQRA